MNNESPVWSPRAEAIYWLNEIEKYQGGANGPTIKLRAAIMIGVNEEPIAYRYKKPDSGDVLWMSGGRPASSDAIDIEPLYAGSARTALKADIAESVDYLVIRG